MSKFDLSDYETVKSRKKRFYKDHPDGSLVVEIVESTDTHAFYKALVFKNKDDQSKNLATATGYAREVKGVGSFANKVSFHENAEESAVGRALDNAGYAGNDKPSREEMEKALETPESVGDDGDLGAYVVNLGKKYLGKRLADIDPTEIEGFINWLRDSSKKDNKPLSKPADEFVRAATAYLSHLDHKENGYA